MDSEEVEEGLVEEIGVEVEVVVSLLVIMTHPEALEVVETVEVPKEAKL